MSKIVISGDEHIRSEEPFYSAKKEYFNWFTEQDINTEGGNILINTGDFFHSKSPTPKDYALAYDFINSCRFKKIYILRGNGAHEFNITRKTHATYPLSCFDNVEVIKKPTVITENNLKILLLPCIPSWNLNGVSLQEYYTDYINNLDDKSYDYIIGHFFHKDGFGEEIDLSSLNGKIRMGHYHIPTEDMEYVGVNTITRADEKGISTHLNIINEDDIEILYDIPKFLDYETLDYTVDTSLPKSKAKYTLYNIVNAPDEKSIYERYGEIYVNKWDKKKIIDTTDGDTIVDGIGSKSLVEFFDLFLKNKKINKILKAKLEQLIKEKE